MNVWKTFILSTFQFPTNVHMTFGVTLIENISEFLCNQYLRWRMSLVHGVYLIGPTFEHSSMWNISFAKMEYKSGPVNSKSFVGKVFLRIKWIFKLNNLF